MKKSPENKMITPNKESNKAVERPAPASAKKRGLVCIGECVMPGIGHFFGGQKITDPAIIEKIGANHPNFQEEK